MEPSIFKLLGDHSGLLCPKLVRAAPSLHDNTVTLFLQHAATHSFFLSSSSLLSPGSTSPTAANFAQLLQTVTRLQSWTALPLASRQQVVKMVGSILTSSKSSAGLLSLTPDFQELLDSSISVCYESAELCPDVLENMVTILDDFPLSVPALISVSVTPGSRDSPQTPIPVTASRSDTDLVLGWLLMLDPGLAKAWNELAVWS